MKHNTANVAQPSWSSNLIALAGLFGLGSLVVYFVPSLPNATSGVFSQLAAVSFHQLLALIVTTALVVIFLAYYRARFFFSTRWLIATVTYSFLLLFVKFTLSTKEIAAQNTSSFGTILITALLVSCLYIFAFTLLYLFFDGKLLNKSLHKALIVSNEGKILLAMGLFICATIVRIIVFQLPILSGSTTSAYLSEIFKSNSLLLSALLFVMIIAAVEAFAQVRRRADLKYFYVTGIAMIVIFHFWWALFIYKGY
jgi:hypothetical protein